MTLTYLELVELTDLAPPCERGLIKQPGNIYCEPINTAEWILRTACPKGCPSEVRLYCTECKDRILTCDGVINKIVCYICDYIFLPVSTAYKSIESLK